MAINISSLLVVNKEDVFNLTGTELNARNGTFQYKALGANATLTDNINDGESIVLRVTGNATHTLTFPTITWISPGGNIAPTLSGNDAFVIWKDSSVLYGAYIGNY